MPNRSSRLTLSSIACATLTTALLTQPLVAFAEDDEEFLRAMSLDDLLDLKITGSTLTEESIQTVPSSVSIFSRDQIRAMAVDTVDELLNYVPGFQAGRQGEDAMQVGFSSRGRKIGTSGREVLILIDGARIDNNWASGGSFAVSRIGLNNIERIEFIRGAGSSVYGSNAFLGVINIVTSSDANEVSVDAGEHNRKRAHIAKTFSLGDVALQAYANLYSDNGDEYQIKQNISNVAPHTPANQFLAKTQDQQDALDLQLKGSWENTQFNLFHLSRTAEDYMVFGTVNNELNRTRKGFTNASVEQKVAWNEEFVSWFRLNFRQLDIQLSAANGDDVTIEDQEYQFKWHNNLDLSELTALQAGFEYRQSHIKQSERLASSSGQLLPLADGLPSQRDIIGAYAQYQWGFNEQFDLTLGGRFDSFSGIGSQFSPRLAGIYHLNDANTIKVLYGEAFRAPSVNELDQINNVLIVGNPDLEPEIVKTWELVWLAKWDKNLLSLSYYDNTFEDSIVQQFTPAGIREFANSRSDETGDGIEVEYSVQLSNELLVRATLTHMLSKPDSAFRESEQKGSLIVNYNTGKFNLNVSGVWLGEREFIEGTFVQNRLTELDSSFTLNTKLTYTLDRNTELYIQAKNLFDESYETPMQNSAVQGAPERGRQAAVGFALQI